MKNNNNNKSTENYDDLEFDVSYYGKKVVKIIYSYRYLFTLASVLLLVCGYFYWTYKIPLHTIAEQGVVVSSRNADPFLKNIQSAKFRNRVDRDDKKNYSVFVMNVLSSEKFKKYLLDELMEKQDVKDTLNEQKLTNDELKEFISDSVTVDLPVLLNSKFLENKNNNSVEIKISSKNKELVHVVAKYFDKSVQNYLTQNGRVSIDKSRKLLKSRVSEAEKEWLKLSAKKEKIQANSPQMDEDTHEYVSNALYAVETTMHTNKKLQNKFKAKVEDIESSLWELSGGNDPTEDTRELIRLKDELEGLMRNRKIMVRQNIAERSWKMRKMNVDINSVAKRLRQIVIESGRKESGFDGLFKEISNTVDADQLMENGKILKYLQEQKYFLDSKRTKLLNIIKEIDGKINKRFSNNNKIRELDVKMNSILKTIEVVNRSLNDLDIESLLIDDLLKFSPMKVYAQRTKPFLLYGAAFLLGGLFVLFSILFLMEKFQEKLIDIDDVENLSSPLSLKLPESKYLKLGSDKSDIVYGSNTLYRQELIKFSQEIAEDDKVIIFSSFFKDKGNSNVFDQITSSLKIREKNVFVINLKSNNDDDKLTTIEEFYQIKDFMKPQQNIRLNNFDILKISSVKFKQKINQLSSQYDHVLCYIDEELCVDLCHQFPLVDKEYLIFNFNKYKTKYLKTYLESRHNQENICQILHTVPVKYFDDQLVDVKSVKKKLKEKKQDKQREAA